METNKTKNTDLFLIDPRNIVVVDGFNVRRDFDLDELKEQIKAKGVLNPLTVIAKLCWSMTDIPFHGYMHGMIPIVP